MAIKLKMVCELCGKEAKPETRSKNWDTYGNTCHDCGGKLKVKVESKT